MLEDAFTDTFEDGTEVSLIRAQVGTTADIELAKKKK